MDILTTVCEVEDIDLKKVLKDERVVKVMELLKKDDLEIILNLDSEESYRGLCTNYLLSSKYTIEVCVNSGLHEDVFYFNRRGILGDVMNPYSLPVEPKNIEDIGVYSILFTILHEYKHYLQYKAGLIENIDISLDGNNKYITTEAQILEDEADDFALAHIRDIMNKCYNCLY